MNRLLASTSLVALALMTAPVLAQVSSPGATAQQAPAPAAQAATPATPSAASPSTDPAKPPTTAAQATTPATPATPSTASPSTDPAKPPTAAAQATTPAAPGAAIAPAPIQRAPAPVAPAAAATPPAGMTHPPGMTMTPPSGMMTPPSGTSAASPVTAPSSRQRASETDTARLIGRTVRNAAEENIGEITSVVIARDGSVSSVIVGVGGFLGIGQREVAIRWQDLMVRDNGASVHTDVTREQLAALPAYQYAENQRPGSVFGAPPTTMTAPATQTPATPTVVPGAAASVSANELIGASVRSPANETIGRVYDILMDGTGAARSLVVSSGGMLGIGDRRVEVPYSEVRVVRDGSSLNVVSRLTALQIGQVAEYRAAAR
jgi:sporulation protein YlmC with PRC-barrel domain